MTVVFVVCGIATIVALAVAPFLLPWPKHLRWLVTTLRTPEPFMGTVADWGDAREVVVESVASCASSISVVVAGEGVQRSVLEAAGCLDAREARLRRWEAAGTPLLQISHPDGTVSLHGPLGEVSGLRGHARHEPVRFGARQLAAWQ